MLRCPTVVGHTVSGRPQQPDANTHHFSNRAQRPAARAGQGLQRARPAAEDRQGRAAQDDMLRVYDAELFWCLIREVTDRESSTVVYCFAVLCVLYVLGLVCACRGGPGGPEINRENESVLHDCAAEDLAQLSDGGLQRARPAAEDRRPPGSGAAQRKTTRYCTVLLMFATLSCSGV